LICGLRCDAKKSSLVISHLRAQDLRRCVLEQTQKQRIQVTDRGVPYRAALLDMEVVRTDENNVRRTNRMRIGDTLRSYYGDLLKEGIPSRLIDLLWRLDEPEKGSFEKED
jgi:hypothetical protein